ncbi:hypothetical protein BT96DRAFT_1014608 [Gymnopus androsaceus JB14]|uniref:Uncharacterized protein n=1 Tax=Gymnopus androsaceus JB14 TaxID=1447944 RepID=A0A6A4IDU3_9AGAR|nr:hypothetical protein BT96DRAFT_1014608 [Gymnopus androsaceus JB14]
MLDTITLIVADSSAAPIFLPLNASVIALGSAPDYIFLLAGLLGDIMLMHRCYRLWNSRKRVIILPGVGLLATIVAVIVLQVYAQNKPGLQVLGLETYYPTNTAQGIHLLFDVYIIITFIQNIILTGMIAGRVWWLNYKVQRMLQLAGQPAKNASQDLLGPILESGALTPIFLLLWMVLNLRASLLDSGNWYWNYLISPCILTEIVGIASTLIVVRIGLGADALASQSHSSMTSHMDLENQDHCSSELPVEPPTDNPSMISVLMPLADMSHETIQPFMLKYRHHGKHSTENNAYTGLYPEDIGMQGETSSGLIQPFQLKYEQDQVEDVSGCLAPTEDDSLHTDIGDGVIHPFQLKYAKDQTLIQPLPRVIYPSNETKPNH